MREFLLLAILAGAWAQLDFYQGGAPCKMQHTLKPDRKIHGEPKSIEPPFQVAIKDDAGAIAKYYEPGRIYTVEMLGHVKFRGFLLQPRLATRDGFIIGHLRGGYFVPEEVWEQLGEKIQRCPPIFNNSLTHSNWKEKFLVKAQWTTDRFVGPVQFYLTILQDSKIYWEQWQPQSGFLLPKPRFSDPEGPNEGKPEIFGENPPQEKYYPTKAEEEEAEEVATTRKVVEPKLSSRASFGSLLRGLNRGAGEEEEEEEESIRKLTLTSTTPQPTTTTPRDYCAGDPCYNGGTCEAVRWTPSTPTEVRPVDFEDGFLCVCPPGWTGETCLKVDHCKDHKCVHGVCRNTEVGYECKCDKEYGADFCDRDCPSYLCEQGGTCTIDSDGNYGCICAAGTTGKRCELEVDECASNPCNFGGNCTDKFNDYQCHCAPGYMGKNCHRACQDIYKTCDLWKRQDHCVVSKQTNFFDVNCASSCGHCEYVNTTIRTESPIPPILEFFQYFIGIWEANSTNNIRFPYDFPVGSTYYETISFLVTKPPMFGTPYLNYTAYAVNNADHSDIKTTKGFVTLRTRPRIPIKIALMSTGNEGVTVVEEGPMDKKLISMKLRPEHLITFPGVKPIDKSIVGREYTLDGLFLKETIRRLVNGEEKTGVKYFYRTTRFEIF